MNTNNQPPRSTALHHGPSRNRARRKSVSSAPSIKRWRRDRGQYKEPAPFRCGRGWRGLFRREVIRLQKGTWSARRLKAPFCIVSASCHRTRTCPEGLGVNVLTPVQTLDVIETVDEPVPSSQLPSSPSSGQRHRVVASHFNEFTRSLTNNNIAPDEKGWKVQRAR